MTIDNFDRFKNIQTEEFTSSDTWTRPSGIDYVYVEACAGGGGGSRNNSVGINEGGQKGSSFSGWVNVAGNLSITIGAAGVGASSDSDGGNGGNTVFGTTTLIGGTGGDNDNDSAAKRGDTLELFGGQGGKSNSTAGDNASGYGCGGGASSSAGYDGGDGSAGFVRITWNN